MVEHVCVKFGDSSCIVFLRHRVEKQANKQTQKRINTTENPIHAPAVGVGNK